MFFKCQQEKGVAEKKITLAKSKKIDGQHKRNGPIF